MHQNPIFSDEELVAYLDGEHEYCRAEVISNEMKSDSQLATRLALLDTDIVAIREAFDQLTNHEAISAPRLFKAANNSKQFR